MGKPSKRKRNFRSHRPPAGPSKHEQRVKLKRAALAQSKNSLAHKKNVRDKDRDRTYSGRVLLKSAPAAITGILGFIALTSASAGWWQIGDLFKRLSVPAILSIVLLAILISALPWLLKSARTLQASIWLGAATLAFIAVICGNIIAAADAEVQISSEQAQSHARAVDLDGKSIEGVIYANEDLRDSRFVDARLSDVDFGGTNLSGSDFRNATLSNVNLSGADLCAVDFRGADLSTVIGFNNVTSYKWLTYDDKTKFPKSFTPELYPGLVDGNRKNLLYRCGDGILGVRE